MMSAKDTTAQAVSAAGEPALDAERLRADFPALHQQVRGKPLVYLDNAATAHKPQAVIDAVNRCYSRDYSNVHRGVHYLSEKATEEYEQAREKVRAFLNARESREIVFLRGTTEAVNLVAQSWGRQHLKSGDEVLITEMEHHANIVPWQLLSEQTGAVLRVAPITDEGELIVEEFEKRLGPRTKLVGITHVSNALGTINPVKQIAALAHAQGARVLVDGAQSVPHMGVDVQDLDCDFYAFSGHKAYGPTGIGALYAKADVLESMPPYQGGGEMIRQVTFKKTTFAAIPQKFEAGTPHIVGAIALGIALDYLQGIGMDAIARYDRELLDYAHRALGDIPKLRVVGTARDKASILSLVFDDIHPHDLGTIVDSEGVAIRTGHHCCMPLMERYCLPATARASLAFYNTRADVDALVAALQKAREMFGP
ncbi:MAG TPA: cysteine desulfurase [Gammaproteobacteria bacterium]|nr:cysteine desulfurase [Gammaproteobacteria bacterium]